MALRDRDRLFRGRRAGSVNNGTYAAMTLGDAMRHQSSGSFTESTDSDAQAAEDTARAREEEMAA
jgi:hypothetical protein